jgi:probable phosphoglycerate mutase
MHLLRHGLIKANAKGLWHGSTDSPLLWRGRRQARKTGVYLAQKTNFSAVYASPLQRCVQTAELASRDQDLEVKTLDGLAEMSIGEWEAQSFKWLQQEHDFVASITRDEHFKAPGGESLAEVSMRVRAAFEAIDTAHGDGEDVLVVSHGVALAVALSSFIDGSPKRWVDYHFNNCSLTEFVLSPEPVVFSFNQFTHL